MSTLVQVAKEQISIYLFFFLTLLNTLPHYTHTLLHYYINGLLQNQSKHKEDIYKFRAAVKNYKAIQ